MGPDGETGIRARLKILFSEKGSAGSTPAWGTSNKVMEKIKKYYPFWLGLIVFIFLNGIEIIRHAPSVGMLIMYLIGYFKLTKLHE